MGKIRYYMDEHVAKAVIRGLRQRGVDVLSVVNSNMLGAKDHEHLERALSERRVIFTQDDDFLQLATKGYAHAGIVCAPQHRSVRQIIQGLMLIYQVIEAEEMVNHCEFLWLADFNSYHDLIYLSPKKGRKSEPALSGPVEWEKGHDAGGRVGYASRTFLEFQQFTELGAGVNRSVPSFMIFD